MVIEMAMNAKWYHMVTEKIRVSRSWYINVAIARMATPTKVPRVRGAASEAVGAVGVGIANFLEAGAAAGERIAGEEGTYNETGPLGASSSSRRPSPKRACWPYDGRMEITQEQIAARAYERFVERGGKHGHDVEDWLAAKADLQRSWQLYDVELIDPGTRRIEVVRTIRDVTGMGLRDIEDVVDAPPGRLWRTSLADAELLKRRLEDLGARVTLRAHAAR